MSDTNFTEPADAGENTMTNTENFKNHFEAAVNADLDARRRAAILDRLNGQNPTLGELIAIIENTDFGPILRSVTLDEIRATHPSEEFASDEEEETPAQRGPGRPRKNAAVVREPAPKRKVRQAAAETDDDEEEERSGRVDYERLSNNVLAYMQSLGTPIKTSGVATEFGIDGTAARKIMSMLIEGKKVVRRGEGRGTEYALRGK